LNAEGKWESCVAGFGEARQEFESQASAGGRPAQLRLHGGAFAARRVQLLRAQVQRKQRRHHRSVRPVQSPANTTFALTHYSPAMSLGNRKKYFQDLFSSVLSQFKEYHPSVNLKFYCFVILQSLKLRILVEQIHPISLKLYFTPNTLGSYGLILFSG